MAGKGVARVLTDRDRELLRFIGQGGLASLVQLHRKFWPKAQLQTCQDRLSQFQKAGWLAAHRIDTRTRGELVFTLTTSGANHFSRGERNRFMLGLPSHAELKQQLLLQAARIMLEERLVSQGHRLLDFRNERELRREQRHTLAQKKTSNGWHNSSAKDKEADTDIADGELILLDETGQEYHIELEVDGAYYGKMLTEKVRALGKGHHHVLWITTPNRAARIQNEIASNSNFSLMVVGERQ